MGLLDNKITQTYVEGNVDLRDLHKLFDEKLGKKFQVKFLNKGNVGQQMIGGENYDRILIAKNAYHRTLISVESVSSNETPTGKDETFIQFNRATLKWWLKAINSNAGFLGAGIIRLIYGSNVPFDNEILDTLKSKYGLKTREMNVGVSALWKKNNNKELQ